MGRGCVRRSGRMRGDLLGGLGNGRGFLGVWGSRRDCWRSGE